MAKHGYVGFLRNEEKLLYVDPDFRELVRSSYKIPGFGSHGVSCAGHFYLNAEENRFNPSLFGHLGFAALSEMSHIIDLLNIIHDHAQSDSDAYMEVDTFNLWYSYGTRNRERYEPSMDLEPFSIITTNEGLYVVQLGVRIGDNGCLELLDEEYRFGNVPFEGHEEVFERSQQRYSQIQKFWRTLGDKVEEYNQRHGFVEVDFTKSEFEPFR